MSAEPVETPASSTASNTRTHPSIRSVVSDDYATASTGRRLALVGVVIWLVYEWGPGNESVTPWLLANVIGQTSGIAVIPVTAAVGFVFTVLQQLASGFTALAAFSMFDRTATAAWNRLRRSSETVPGEWTTIGWPARCVIVFSLGTTAVALVQVTTTGQVGVRRHASAVRSSALLCGTIVALIAALAAAFAYLGRKVSALSGATDWILRILGNPLFWLGMLAASAAIGRVVRRHRAIRSLKVASTAADISTVRNTANGQG